MDGDIRREVALVQVVRGHGVPCLVIGQSSPVDRCQFAGLAQAKLVHILCLNEVFVGDLITTIKMSNDDCFVDDVFDGYRRIIHQTLN